MHDVIEILYVSCPMQAIYNRGMTVDQLLDMLKQFKDSNNKKEKVSSVGLTSYVIVFI